MSKSVAFLLALVCIQLMIQGSDQMPAAPVANVRVAKDRGYYEDILEILEEFGLEFGSGEQEHNHGHGHGHHEHHKNSTTTITPSSTEEATTTIQSVKKNVKKQKGK